MLNDEIRTVEESYTSAATSSNLRCEADRRTDVDVLIAAGCTPGILGAALMRLHSEWDGSERMRPAVAADFVSTARQRPADSRKPVQTTAALLTAAQKMAHDHNAQQAKLLMANLKTMPRVVGVLAEWAVMRALPDPQALAQAVVTFWLDSNCHSCHGRGNEVIPGTPSLGRKCKACNGTGKRKEPRGEAGRLMLSLMEDSVTRARTSMKKRLHQSSNV
jgi:hypothetical protein